MTGNEQALLAQMQDLVQILSQSKQAVSDMLAYIYDEQPSEEEFIAEIARICDLNGLSPQL